VATSNHREFAREKQSVIEGVDPANPGIEPLLPRVAADIAGENALAFPSEEDDGSSQAAYRSLAPDSLARHAARSPIFVVVPSDGPLASVPVDAWRESRNVRRRDSVAADNAAESARLAFPSEEDDGSAARSSIFVIVPSDTRSEPGDRFRNTVQADPVIGQRLYWAQADVMKPLASVPVDAFDVPVMTAPAEELKLSLNPSGCPTGPPRQPGAQYVRSAIAFMGAWWRTALRGAYGLTQRVCRIAQRAQAIRLVIDRVLSGGLRQCRAVHSGMRTYARALLEGALSIVATVVVGGRRLRIAFARSISSAWDGAGRVLLFAIGRCCSWHSTVRSLQKRLQDDGTLAAATLSSLCRQTALATRRWTFATTRAVSIAIASGKDRGRASFVTLYRRARSLSERSTSLSATAWTTSRRATLTAGRYAAAAIGSFSGAAATRGRHPIALSAYGMAVGVVGVVLLMPRVPSMMTAMRIGDAPAHRLGETPSAAAKVPEAPIPLPTSLAAGVSSAAADGRTTGASRSGQEVRQTALNAARELPVAGPATAPSGDRTRGRQSGEPGRAVGNMPVPRPSAAPRPASVRRYTGSLVVRSSPEGAQVFINTVSVGATPLLLPDMPVGSRAVRVELIGYQRWSSAVRIVARERTLVVAKLLPSTQ
jgi:PEGA domain-containing protein